MIYRGGVPFYIDPLIAWGRPGEKYAVVRAQLWDAVLKTVAMQMDEQETWDGLKWINYTHQHFYGALLLWTGEGGLQERQASYAY